MATSSITKNFVISGKRQVEMFADAIEASANNRPNRISVTAKEIKYLRSLLKNTHKNQTVVVVDAAVGQAGDIGTIKITDAPLYPGAGANKKLGCIGDISIMGIVAEKSIANYALLNTTRLNLVYRMSEIIASALANVLYNL